MPAVLASTQPGRSTTTTTSGTGRRETGSARSVPGRARRRSRPPVQFADDVGGVLPRRLRTGAHQAPGGPAGEGPVDHRGGAAHRPRYADGVRRTGAQAQRQPQPASVAAMSSRTASTAASLPAAASATTAKASRPSAVTTVPARAWTPSRVPVLARTVPGAVPGRRPRGRRACRRSRRPAGRTAARRHRRCCRRPPRAPGGEHGGGHRSSERDRWRRQRHPGDVDPGLGERLGDRLGAALEAGRQVAGERDLAGQRLGEHVVRLRQHLLDQARDRRGLHRGQGLGAARAVPRTTVAPRAPRASARAEPASMPGCPLRACEPGLTRAPSTAVAVTGAA